MARVKRGNVARKRRNKILKANKGFRGASKRIFTVADRVFLKAGKNAYEGRRERRRFFRRLWIARINGAVRQLGMRYSVFMSLLNKLEIDIDRKQLADLAFNNSEAFKNFFNDVKNKASSKNLV